MYELLNSFLILEYALQYDITEFSLVIDWQQILFLYNCVDQKEIPKQDVIKSLE